MTIEMTQVVRYLLGPIQALLGAAAVVSLVEPTRGWMTPVLRVDPVVSEAASVVIMIDNDALLATCANAAQFLLEGDSVDEFLAAVIELVAKVANGDLQIEFRGSQVRRVRWRQAEEGTGEAPTCFASYGLPS